MIKKNQIILAEKELKNLREQINKQDRLLLLVLKNRFKIVKKIALLKKKHNLPILQKFRWKTIIEDRIKAGLKLKIEPEFTSALMKLIHKESIRFQLSLQKIQNNKGDKNE